MKRKGPKIQQNHKISKLDIVVHHTTTECIQIQFNLKNSLQINASKS